MAQRPKRGCRYPNCPALCHTGWCSQHLNNDRKAYDKARGNSYQRGYDKRWSAFRLRYLALNALCMDCLDAVPQRITPANEVHHIVKLADAAELKYESSNLKSLCKPCHSARSRRGE